MMLSASQKTSLREAAQRYHSNVLAVASYLDGRGVSEKAAGLFRLGCVVDPMPGHERFDGWVSIPYVTAVDDVVAFKFRNPNPDADPKYDSPAGQTARLFNARSLASGGELALVLEGEMDTIMASSMLEVPAVGSPGTTWLDHWSRCFGEFERVVVIGDHDAKPDGSDPGLKHAQKVRKAIDGAELVLPPAGMDFSEWVLEYGVDAVKEKVGL